MVCTVEYVGELFTRFFVGTFQLRVSDPPPLQSASATAVAVCNQIINCRKGKRQVERRKKKRKEEEEEEEERRSFFSNAQFSTHHEKRRRETFFLFLSIHHRSFWRMLNRFFCEDEIEFGKKKEGE